MTGFRIVLAVSAVCLLGAAGVPAEETATEERRSWKMAAFPAMFYTPETGFGIGGGAVFTYRNAAAPADARPQNLSMVLLGTTKKQAILTFAPELYLGDEKWVLRMSTGYQSYPTEFYGIGKDTSEDSEEEYKAELTHFRL